MVKRGEVRWYQFAPPDKRRPVVVLTRDSVISYLGEVTVAPVTTLSVSTMDDVASAICFALALS